nr:hypothetical protein [Rhodococcus wratislaviensis]GLK39044.1 hypothetical protein GCM10017611_59140 [Rhodococcus wratislaviensis]
MPSPTTKVSALNRTTMRSSYKGDVRHTGHRRICGIGLRPGTSASRSTRYTIATEHLLLTPARRQHLHRHPHPHLAAVSASDMRDGLEHQLAEHPDPGPTQITSIRLTDTEHTTGPFRR